MEDKTDLSYAPVSTPAPEIVADLKALLKGRGLRPTRHRMTVAQLLFPKGSKTIIPRHCTAEEIHQIVKNSGIQMSLATVYNTLNQFSQYGILRKVSGGANCSFYDTVTEPHHHIYHENDNRLEDVSPDAPEFQSIAEAQRKLAPNSNVEVMVRVSRDTKVAS